MITKEDIDAVASLAEPISQMGHHDMEPDWLNHIDRGSPLHMVTQFAKSMNQPINTKWLTNFKLEELRFKFIQEEFEEYAMMSSEKIVASSPMRLALGDAEEGEERLLHRLVEISLWLMS